VDLNTNTTKKVTLAAINQNAAAGTAAAPGMAFDGDSDTGWYRTGANAIGLAQGGSQTIDIDSAGNVSLQATSHLKLPVGTSAQRPGSPATGMTRYNSSLGWAEIYDGTQWTIVETRPQIGRLTWNQTADTYTSLADADKVIDVQSRLRRCILTDTGVVAYYLDADDSTKKAGDWLRIVENQTISVDYTGTHSETTNAKLREGVPAWSAGTYSQGNRVTYGGSLWECIVTTTTATPAAGSISAVLDGTDGQVMVEVPCFSVRYTRTTTSHAWEVRRGAHIEDGWQVHRAFLRADGRIRDFLYIGAYQSTGTSPATTVSGASNRVSATRATFRSAATARGSGWHLWSQYDLAAVQLLMVTEFQTLNTQRKLGNGAQEGNVYVVNTGLSNAQGNKSQNAYTGGGSNTDYVSYRGLENVYGRAWQWTDGFNVNNYVAYLSHTYATFADDTATGYTAVGTVPSGVSGAYQTGLMTLPDAFIPSLASGGSSTTRLADGLWTDSGWRVPFAGGGANAGAIVGAFCLYLNAASSSANSNFGSRLAFGAI
jgi:hypothetical protein